MLANEITIKAGNHRIYQSPNSKKIELINKIISENETLDILVVCSSNVDALKESLASKDVRVVEDRELVKDKSMNCEFLIGYDMPIKDIVYIARISRATQKAVTLLNEEEQKSLHDIETLLGRAIKQEIVDGFGYEVKVKQEEKVYKKKPLTKTQISEIAKKRHEDATQEKVVKEYPTSPKKDFAKKDKWDKDKKSSGKFSDKKDDKRKKPFSGKKITIKSLKPSTEI